MAYTFTRLLSRRRLVVSTLGATASAALVALPARCQGRVYPGATALGTDLSGMTRDQSRALLETALAPFLKEAVTFTYADRSWTASLEELGYTVEFDAMLDDAMGRGRQEGIVDRYTSLLGINDSYDVQFLTSLKSDNLRAYLRNIDQEIRIEASNARLVTARGVDVRILPARIGRELDLAAAESTTMSAIAHGRHSTVALQSVEISPETTEATLANAKGMATQLISSPVVFTFNEERFPIESKDLATALVIRADGSSSLDADRITARIDAIANAVGRAPSNVMLGWDSGLYVVADDADGVELDRTSFGEALTSTARSASRTAPLPVQSVPAAARADNLPDLGIEKHLAYGSSAFTGSSETRATNVMVSASNISYKLVAPGDTFSFNELLGPITLEMGYVEGTIIQGDWAASDIGGGVCQVSTTVFRAAATVGFQFDEWNPHSWRLGFYEIDGSPPGFDAAIYQPNFEGEWEKDLRFQNTLDSWLLLMLIVDGDTVRAHFYGRNPGWSVQFGEAQVSEPKPIPAAVERHNSSLPAGERRLVQHAQPGYVVRIRRTVTDSDGSVLSDGDFVSDYRSQPEAWEVG